MIDACLSDALVGYLDEIAEPEKERDPYRLFASDVGKCPRMLAYRFRGEGKNPTSEQQQLSKRLMFHNALSIEQTLERALDHADMLVTAQGDIPFTSEFPNWGGRFDFLVKWPDIGLGVLELKTLHPNAFRHDLWWPEHHHQVNIYHYFLSLDMTMTAVPRILYMDRGGQNYPVIVDSRIPVSETIEEMRSLTRMRDWQADGADLPPKREKVLKVRNYNKRILEEPHYNCTRCDYSDTCKPDMSKTVWATRSSQEDLWEIRSAADKDKLSHFVETTLLEKYNEATMKFGDE